MLSLMMTLSRGSVSRVHTSSITHSLARLLCPWSWPGLLYAVQSRIPSHRQTACWRWRRLPCACAARRDSLWLRRIVGRPESFKLIREFLDKMVPWYETRYEPNLALSDARSLGSAQYLQHRVCARQQPAFNHKLAPSLAAHKHRRVALEAVPVEHHDVRHHRHQLPKRPLHVFVATATLPLSAQCHAALIQHLRAVAPLQVVQANIALSSLLVRKSSNHQIIKPENIQSADMHIQWRRAQRAACWPTRRSRRARTLCAAHPR